MGKTRFASVLKITGLSLAVFVLLVLVTGAGVVFAYRNKFYPGVSVGTVKLSGQTKTVGQANVQTAVAADLARAVIVVVPNTQASKDALSGEYPNTEVKTTAKDLGLTYNSDKAVTAAWSIGHTYTVRGIVNGLRHIFSTESSQPLEYSVNQDQITAFLNVQLLPKISAPVPAKIAINGTVVSVTEPQPGLTLDPKAVSEQLALALPTAADGDTIYVRPSTTLEDSPVTTALIQPIANQLDQLGNMNVLFSMTGLGLKPARTDILSWYTPVQDSAGNFSLQFDGDKVAAYLQQHGGTKIDQQKSTDAAIAALKNTVTKPVNAVSADLISSVKTPVPVTAGSYTLGDYPGKYIEVNLKEQKMYRINGDTLEKVYIVSSGKWSTPTPIGTFTLNGHIPRAYSAEFGLYMPNWINFKDNKYGIHELPEWPDGYKEGANHLGTPVSHGCIRLGVGDAKEIYDWTPDGTPLIIRAS